MGITEEYIADRDEATITVVEQDDLEVFKAFVQKWQEIGIYPDCFELPSDNILAVCVRQMAVHETNIPEGTRKKAKVWLLEKGYSVNPFE